MAHEHNYKLTALWTGSRGAGEGSPFLLHFKSVIFLLLKYTSLYLRNLNRSCFADLRLVRN